jgi:hypothetical protein
MSQSLGDRPALNVDTTAPRRIVFGNTAAATDLRFKETYGKNNDRLALVIALASHQVNSIQTVTFDSVLVWNSAQNGANNNDVAGNKYDDGYDFVNPIACGIAANAVALGSGNYWTRSSTFTGCAYMRIAFREDKTKVWTNGLPQKYTTVVEGCPLYDPRLDSTNGGSGSMRPTDQTTWKYYNGAVAIGRNPALAILTYIIGYKINGVLAWGMGIPLNRINMQSFIQYANLCEEQVQAADGTNIPRFTVDGIFDTSETHEDILNAICLCMGTAILTDTDGVFQFSGGYDDTLTPAFSFGPDDVLSGGVWTPSEPSRSRFNRVQGRFADPTNLYTLATWGEVAVDTLADDIPRTQTVDFGAVNRAESCQRLAKQMVVKSKYGGTYTAVFGLRGFCVSVGSLCTLSGMNGWNNKLFRVVTQDETFDLTYQMTLREESPEIYEWDSSEEKALPAGILDSLYDPVTAEAVVGLTAEAVSINGTNSVDTIYINVAWTPAQSLRTTSIEIQSQVAGSTIWSTEAERFDPVAGAFKFAAGVNGAAITVQARYHMDNGAYGDWVTSSLSSTPVSTVNQWSAVYDDGDGTKPQDGATVGAQTGSNLKDSNGNTLGDGDVITGQGTSADTSHVAGIPSATVTGNISDLLTNVGDLQTTYGSTAAAATSATNAANSASSASTANTNAQTAATNAATANTAATAAKTAAQAAQTAASNSQTAAATSASTAAVAATNATTANTNAQSAVTAAQAAQAAALTQAGNASASATAANSSAGQASTSAGQASTSATNAAGSATAAASSASVSASSGNNAIQTVAQSLPTDFQNDGQFWSSANTGAPTRASITANSVYSFPVAGNYLICTPTVGSQTSVDVANLGAITVQAGRTYQISANFTVTNIGTGGTNPNFTLYEIYLNSSYAQTTNGAINLTTVSANGTYTMTMPPITGDAVLASGSNTGAMLRALFRCNLISNARTGLVYQLNNLTLEDVTESAKATAQASAAATSASNAATSATNAGTSATSAQSSATTATTQAGNAQTFATNASTSATNAQGFANTATTQAGVAASSAATATLTAAQTLPTDFTQQGQFYYSGYQGAPSVALATAVSTAVTFTTVTGLGPVALVSPPVGQNVDTSMAGVLTVAPGRIYQLTVTYEGKTASSGLFVNPFIIGLNSTYTYVSTGSASVNIPITDTSLHTATVQIHGDTVIAAGCNAIRALLRIGIAAGGTAGGSAYLVSGVLEDVTSVTAAATSASSAATSATNAGTSATSAQSAATTATTQAGNAQTYASNASTSATNAQGFANTATTQAGVAASSANNAIQTVAQTLPSDWQNDGQFWSRNYLGVPTRASLVATAGIIAFPTSGNYVTFTAVSSITADIAALGAVTIAPGRTYRTTANWSVINLGSGTAVRVETFCVGLTSDYLANVYTPSNTPAAPTATGAQTPIVVIVNGDAAIAAGAAMLRPVFRINSAGVANTGFTVQINSFLLEDITESTTATTQASAAAGSASNASTSATNAGTSATAAAASATSASTAAGNASTYASNASTSATNAAGSATSAATQAGVAATSASTAQTAALYNNPSTFEQGNTYFTGEGGNANPNAITYVAVSQGQAAQNSVTTTYGAIAWGSGVPHTAGNTYRIRAYVNCPAFASGQTTANVRLRANLFPTQIPNNNRNSFADSQQTITTVNTWQWVTADINLGASVAFALPEVILNYTPSNTTVQCLALEMIDVTSQLAAASSATAAATSASNAATSATSAGTSATSASNSATTATTQAGNAQTFATNASTSATNAAGSANTASTASGAASTSATNAANSATAAGTSATTAATQATNASNSATAANTSAINASSSYNNVVQNVATTLPQDFQQDGTFWAPTYSGPTTRTQLAANTTFVFPASGNYVTINAVSGAVATDLANLGALPIVAGHTYTLTANYTVINIGTGGTASAQIYYIPLNNSYTYTAGGEQPTPITATGTFNATVTMVANTVLTAQPTSTMFRALFRIQGIAGVSGVVVQLNNVVIADITSSLAASGSATAAATSASNASTSAGQAGASATSASGFANTASTAATNAATSATSASASAATATTQAAAATQSATLAAQVGSGDTNLNSMFANWASTTTYPTNWASGSGVTPAGNLTRVTGMTSTYAARITSAAAANTYMVQQGSNNAPWDINVSDWIVLEADFFLNSGALTASGLLFRANGSADISVRFAIDKDISDAVIGAGVAGNPYSFRKLVQVTAGGNTSSQLFAMNAYSGFGSIAGANDITWYRCGWRPASTAEIAAQRADTNAAQALANITSEASTRASADSALSTTVNTLNAYVNTNPNLIQNPTGANGFNGWTINTGTGWSTQQGASEGYFFWQNSYSAPANGAIGFTQDVPVYAGVGYSLQGLVSATGLTASAGARLYMEFLNSAKAHLGYSNGGTVPSVPGGTSWTQLGTAANQNQITPAGCAYIRVICDIIGPAAWTATNVAWRRIKLEQGGACTNYTDDATAAQLASSVSVQQGAIASLQGRTEAYWNVDVQSGTGRAIVALQADGVSGSSSLDLVAGSINLATTADGLTYKTVLATDTSGNVKCTGDIIWTNGSVMKVAGVGFGTSNQFIEWFGPVMALTSCSESNATMYLRNDGAAYFGGALSSGTLTTKAGTSDTGATATAETNVFGSNGHTITVAVSYTGTYAQHSSYAGTSQGLTQFNAAVASNGATSTGGSIFSVSGSDPGAWSVDLYRAVNGGGYTKVATLTDTGTWGWSGVKPNGTDPGFADAFGSQGSSLTYTDPQNLAQSRQYKAVLTARNPHYGITTQNISLVCVEQ